MDYSAVNWVAVVVAAVANSVVGFIWYLPQVFGNRWAAETGRTMLKPSETPPMTVISAIVLSLVTAYVLAVIAHALGVADAGAGAVLGLLVAIGFVLTWGYNGVLWEGRSRTSWAINAGASLVELAVVGAIIGYWPK
jgi:hypothetical protein